MTGTHCPAHLLQERRHAKCMASTEGALSTKLFCSRLTYAHSTALHEHRHSQSTLVGWFSSNSLSMVHRDQKQVYQVTCMDEQGAPDKMPSAVQMRFYFCHRGQCNIYNVLFILGYQKMFSKLILIRETDHQRAPVLLKKRKPG